jgi:hypothetical protein
MSVDPADLKAWQSVVGATPDGNPGPRTFLATVEWFRAHGYIAPRQTTPASRARVVRIARAELGEQNPDKYWRDAYPPFIGHAHDKAWCGAFALWCLRQACLVDWTWIDGKGFLEVYAMPKVQLPELGDVAYFAKNSHHAIVAGVGGGNVTLINGNGMLAPREGVTETNVPLVGAVTAFYSIERLLP